MALGRGYMDRTPRGRGSEGQGRRRGRHRRRGSYAGVVPPPMQTQIPRMGGMSSAVIGGFCEHSPVVPRSVVHELVAKFADAHGRQRHYGERPRVAAQRGHSIPEAPHATAASHRGMVRLPGKQNSAPGPYVDPSTEYARTLRHLQASDARWRAEKTRAQPDILGTQGVGGPAGGHRPLGGAPPPPQPGLLRESGGDAPT
jgi:hypothetical protein